MADISNWQNYAQSGHTDSYRINRVNVVMVGLHCSNIKWKLGLLVGRLSITKWIDRAPVPSGCTEDQGGGWSGRQAQEIIYIGTKFSQLERGNEWFILSKLFCNPAIQKYNLKRWKLKLFFNISKYVLMNRY